MVINRVLSSLSSCKKKVMHIPKLFIQTQCKHETEKSKITKIVNVAIIGAPNSGKSTLINNIVGRKICAASNKVHTTVKMIRAMCTSDDVQIIFLDTPGIVTPKEQKKYELPNSMTESCHKSVRVANIIGVVHDISNKWSKDSLHPHVIRMLSSAEGIPSFLIINKIDVLKSKRQLLTAILSLTNGLIAGKPIPGSERKRRDLSKEIKGYQGFSDVFMVSALNGDGVEDIKEYLKQNSKPSNLQYSEDLWTDQKPEKLIEEAVRAKFLDFLPQEIPYKLRTKLEYFEETEEKIICTVVVFAPSERISKLIQGAGSGRFNQIKNYVMIDLCDMFKKQTVLDLYLQVERKEV